MPNTDSTVCPTCERDDFESEKGMKIHHQSAHGESIAGVSVTCDHCGTETRTPRRKVEKLDHHFCDQDCESEWRSGYLQGKNSPQWNGGKVEIECHYCDTTTKKKPHEIESAERNFCSNECRGEWRSENWTGSNHPRWRGGDMAVECSYCGETVSRRRDQVEKYELNFCNTTCLGKWRSENQRGADNPVWTGGESIRVAVRNLIGDRPWEQIAARVRDSECKLCGVSETEDGRALAVHHIVPIMAGGCNEEALLMTLCPSCHRKVEAYTRGITESCLAE